jgi:hypothetical protein
LPDTWWLDPEPLEADAPVPEVPVLEEELPVSLPDLSLDEPVPAVSELLPPLSIVPEPLELDPDRSLDSPEDEGALVPDPLCARAGSPSASSAVTPRPATIPIAMCFIG